jgi:hypothetical protein
MPSILFYLPAGRRALRENKQCLVECFVPPSTVRVHTSSSSSSSSTLEFYSSTHILSVFFSLFLSFLAMHAAKRVVHSLFTSGSSFSYTYHVLLFFFFHLASSRQHVLHFPFPSSFAFRPRIAVLRNFGLQFPSCVFRSFSGIQKHSSLPCLYPVHVNFEFRNR